MTIDTHNDRERLMAEKTKLEEELSRIAIRSGQNPAHWETKPPALDTDAADEGEEGFAMQSFEQNAAIVADLEIRLNEVESTLAQINTTT